MARGAPDVLIVQKLEIFGGPLPAFPEWGEYPSTWRIWRRDLEGALWV